MLENIIKQQCNEFDNNGADSKYISDIEKESQNILNEINTKDKELGMKVEELISGLISAYGMAYFEAGFKDGLKLTNQIKGCI